MGSIFAVPSEVAVWWEATTGQWIVALPPNYPKADLTRVRDHLLKTQKQRRLGLIPGELRDDLDRSVEALKHNRFAYKAQHDSEQRAILFERPDRERKDRTFNFPKGA
jgi:hypothetical protein